MLGMQGSPAVTRSLLQLPREIRDLIWECLLISTTILSGKYYSVRGNVYVVKPNPNILAILRTCRQTYHETKDLWLKLVLFDFQLIDSLLDKFSPLPLPILSKISRARVHLQNLQLWTLESPVSNFRLGDTLTLLPGLQLKTLEIHTNGLPDVRIYDSITNLIERSNGWRELQVYISHSRVLAFKNDRYEVFSDRKYRRSPQPDSWARTLRRRDGQNSESAVMIYRARQRNAVYNSSIRKIFTQEPQADPSFGLAEDEFLMSKREAKKKMLIVVKRSPDADIVVGIEDQNAPEDDKPGIRQWAANIVRQNALLDGLGDIRDIREFASEMTWEDVKKVTRGHWDASICSRVFYDPFFIDLTSSKEGDDSSKEGDDTSEEGNFED
ncbi:MAG: hypothetical protein M1839_006768 [Geoglossum umbratile]|nr:MAG: hypothetical protein M1839_006768 [Geoglossum umbratile]